MRRIYRCGPCGRRYAAADLSGCRRHIATTAALLQQPISTETAPSQSPSPSTPSPSSTADGNGGGGTTRTPVRAVYPRIRMRAQTERPAPAAYSRVPGQHGAEGEREDPTAARPDAPPQWYTSGGAAAEEEGSRDGPQHTPTATLQRAPQRARRRPTATATMIHSLPNEEPQAAEAADYAGPSPSSAAVQQRRGDVADGVGGQREAAGVAAAAGADEAPRAVAASAPELNEVQNFLEAVQQQVEQSRYERNQAIPYPEDPDRLVPVFRRVKRHKKMEVVVADPDFPVFPRKDSFVELPPPGKHPWVKNTPIGHVIHGDGQLGVVGTGEVGFEDANLRTSPLPAEGMGEATEGDALARDAEVDELTLRRERRGWRGLRHQSILQRHLPQNNGKVLQDAVIRHSFTLTGRGVFATRDIRPGETIMIVESTAQSLGVKGEVRRLEDMVVDILVATHEAFLSDPDGTGAELKQFLYDWILTGQPSSLLEHWPTASTQRVLDAIGGRAVLDDLELHTIHVARLAAVIDLNSFLVESFYAERKGMAYFPEAGFLNHSCVPNATYDIMPQHTFRESDYYIDEALHEGAEAEAEAEEEVEVDDAPGVEGKETRDTATRNAAYLAVQPPTHSGSSRNKGVDYLAVSDAIDLTETGAPRYLFCCRAEAEIKAGEEILISYVPPGWSFDNRQYVLHDRYHFWCKCPKCAPVLDTKYARVPRFFVGIVLLSIFLQGLLLYHRGRKNEVDEEVARLSAMSAEERLEELRARGIDIEDMTMDAQERRMEEGRKQGRMGLIELIEREKLRQAYQMEGTMYNNNPLQDAQNPYPSIPANLR